MGIPREIGRELRWQLAWEYSFGPAVSDTPETAAPASYAHHVPVETGQRFAILDSRTGEAVAAGLKTEVFHASSQAMINQAADAPRWAVQSWDGRMLRVVPRRGIPRLHGVNLLQFSEESVVYGDRVTGGERWELDLPKNATVYDLAQNSAGETWFSVGTLEGTVLLAAGSAGSDREWRHTVERVPPTANISTIYGIAVAARENSENDTALPPSVHLVHGFNPQVVSRLDFGEGGTVDRVEIDRISQEYASRGPRRLFFLEQELLVTGLNGALFVARSDDDSTATIPLPGLLDLSGIGRAQNGLVVATGRGEQGPVILSGTANLTTIASWELADELTHSMVHARSPSESTVIVQHDDQVVGLELTL